PQAPGATAGVSADGFQGQPVNESFGNAPPEKDGNRGTAGGVAGAAANAVPGGERKRNPKNRRRARRGPRSAGAQAVGAVNTSVPDGGGNPQGSSGNEGEGS
ncbi:MAG: hypothetical protein LH481_10800, partial [Burkholderiales bacterium]|nr:hypothetical protein [Burkholderiales bacterium]